MIQANGTEIAQSLDELCTTSADPLNSFSLMREDWEHFKLNREQNTRGLFTDRLNDWLVPFCGDCMGGLAGKTVLELGPYEGFHSHSLQQAGAAKIISIEANPRNFMKCLIVKNYYQLDRVTFLLGDLMAFLETTDMRFDLVFASGILYHLSQPFKVLDLIIEKTDSIGICTTYYDENQMAFQFTGNTRVVQYPDAEPLTLYEAPNPKGTKQRKHGIDSHAWMFKREDLLKYLEYRQFHVALGKLHRPVQGNPRIRLFASRTPPITNTAAPPRPKAA